MPVGGNLARCGRCRKPKRAESRGHRIPALLKEEEKSTIHWFSYIIPRSRIQDLTQPLRRAYGSPITWVPGVRGSLTLIGGVHISPQCPQGELDVSPIPSCTPFLYPIHLVKAVPGLDESFGEGRHCQS